MSIDWWDSLPYHPANQKDDDDIEEVICDCCAKIINEEEKSDGLCDECYDALNEENLINKIEKEVDSLIKLYQKETGEHVNKNDVELLNLINQLKERLDL